MYVFEYDFLPNGAVFIVIDNNEIETGVVMSMSFKKYLDNNSIVSETAEYLVLLDNLELGSVTVNSTNIYATLSEAASNIIS
jgi:hypothetical protein